MVFRAEDLRLWAEVLGFRVDEGSGADSQSGSVACPSRWLSRRRRASGGRSKGCNHFKRRNYRIQEA
jgi:hypothetical protein